MSTVTVVPSTWRGPGVGAEVVEGEGVLGVVGEDVVVPVPAVAVDVERGVGGENAAQQVDVAAR